LRATTIIGCLAGLFFSTAYADSLPHVLEKTLIAGASISADRSSLSPGKKLALRYTSPEKVMTHAFGGRPAYDVWQRLPDTALGQSTILIALDLFFWDSVYPSQRRSLATLKKVIEAAKKENIPFVLADIPDLLAGRQWSRETLNEAIRSACVESNGCILFPLEALHEQLKRDGYLHIRGRKYTKRELLPDGLHLSDIASEHLADLLAALLNQRLR